VDRSGLSQGTHSGTIHGTVSGKAVGVLVTMEVRADVGLYTYLPTVMKRYVTSTVPPNGVPLSRDAANEWLSWNIHRSTDEKYYIPICSHSGDVRLEVRLKATYWSSNIVLEIADGNWTITVYDDSGSLVDQLGDAMPSSHTGLPVYCAF
jgi:hypothetical protein